MSLIIMQCPEAAVHRCCSEKALCKNAANLPEITHEEVRFQ